MARSDGLPETMQAVVCHGPGDYRLEEVETPSAGDGEVVIRVGAAGVCASDLKCYQGAPTFWGSDGRSGYCQPPVIAGHEFAGEVVALGAGAGEKYGLALGDMAVSEQIVPCWSCRYCQRGQYWMCDRNDVYGFRQRTPGAMAQYMRFPADALNYKVPVGIPMHHAAFIEPLACSIHAVERGNITFHDTVVIAGCGPLGLGMVAAARARGPASIIALDMRDERLDIARRCGADVGINPGSVDAIEAVMELTEGHGCDVYLEATGHPSAVGQGLQMIRKLGTFVEFSVMREPVTVDWTLIGDTKELNVHGSHLGPHCYPVAIRMIERGLLPLDDIVTHQLPLEAFQTGFDLVAAGDASLKVLLVP